MKIYFDPEYLEIVNNSSSQSVVKASKTAKTASYKMQMINVDFQQSQLLDIFIEDLRTNKPSGT